MARSIVRIGYSVVATDVAAVSHRVWRLASALVARLTLVQRFALVSAAILVTGAFIIGRYVADEIEDGVVARSSSITALYVDSFVSPTLQGISEGTIAPDKRRELDRLLIQSSLGREIVAFKVWDPLGRIVYARDPALIGQQFERKGGLAAALQGHVQASISDLGEEEHQLQRLQWSRLLETYAPIREDETGAIIGAMEFYQDSSDLEAEIGSSQQKGWIIVGISTAGMYLLLVGLVKGASSTLVSQHRSLTGLAQENARLARQVRKAAAQKTETDEQLFMRIAHDLHDGPAQDLGLALLRIRSLRQGTQKQLGNAPEETERVREDFQLVETALAGALKEVREMSSDLRLPELAELNLAEVVEKAKLDHERRTGSAVSLQAGSLPHAPSNLPLKITVYRVLQEALNNSYRHAGATEQRITVSHADGWIELEVTDNGPGFDPEMLEANQEARPVLGLRGMRERVEMLGGTLMIASGPNRGTSIRVRLPLESETA